MTTEELIRRHRLVFKMWAKDPEMIGIMIRREVWMQVFQRIWNACSEYTTAMEYPFTVSKN